MSNCIKITVTGLSQVAKNVLGTDSAVIDILGNDSIRLTKSVELLTDANKVQTQGALATDLPDTPTNRAVFSEFATPTVLDNRRVFYPVSIQLAGHSVPFNRMVVIAVPPENGGKWSVEFQRSPDHWLDLTSTKKINSIDFGTFVFSKANIVANWAQNKWRGEVGQVPYAFRLMDYGGWCDRTLPNENSPNTAVKAVSMEDFRPLVSLPYLLKQGFCEIGWTLDGVIFDTDYIAGLYIYALNQTYYDAGSDIRVSVLATADINGSGSFLPLTFDTLDNTNGYDINVFSGFGFFAGIINRLNIEYLYRFEFTGKVQNFGVDDWNHTFHVCEVENTTAALFTGEVLSDEIQILCPAGQTTDIYLTFDVALKPGQRAAIRMPDINISSSRILKGARGSVRPNDMSFYVDQTIEIKAALRDDILLDYFKAFCHVTRSQFTTDYLTKTVTVFPKNKSDVFGEIVPGFYRDESPNDDISNLVIQGSVTRKLVNPDKLRFLRLSFKDSTDYYIDTLQLQEPLYSRKILNGETLKDGITEIKNLVFEPTKDGDAKALASGANNRQPKVLIPRLWDNTDGKRSFDIAPRIFYDYGLVKQENPAQVNGIEQFTSFFFDNQPNNANTGLVQNFGFASQLPLWPLDPLPDFYGNTVFSPENADLFSIFYLSITNEYRRGETIDLLINLSMAKYNAIDFRDIYKFVYNGRPITALMSQIRDAALCSNTPTPVTFFVNPSKSECCDLPCGCIFSTCEYYQDFGSFLRKTTLDELKIKTFTVDGISVIDSPVGFGVLKMVNVLGKPFVANLVDTLNSIGAPYMTFGYAQRLSSAKGARFFTVKRPACTAFEIVIGNLESDLYKYTDTSQAQSWFGVGFSALGYGAESYAVPENCVTSKEY